MIECVRIVQTKRPYNSKRAMFLSTLYQKRLQRICFGGGIFYRPFFKARSLTLQFCSQYLPDLTCLRFRSCVSEQNTGALPQNHECKSLSELLFVFWEKSFIIKISRWEGKFHATCRLKILYSMLILGGFVSFLRII